ncbi:cupin-like domain-containing protein [Pseudomarimonas arenosa]|uniref:Cupin-like domain-containing protein n=1 Tax=Pseudomarimonas arenosa TaxID=2774145 RepID=A0AAW3ZKD1_9GAMM|nr:cupin-like domain-containing protein [Pseudomarimonas arenosa]MBD8526471.1 cupin-like domain-containing protein [Pseudomarimonas arenosa]
MSAELKCFAPPEDSSLLDRRGFKLQHRLLGHPALELSNLAQVLPTLPSSNVYYSRGDLKPSDNFDRAHIEHKNGLSLADTIEAIRTSDSYIMVRSPELHPSFQELFADLSGDVRSLLRARGQPDQLHGAKLYLFIASPNSLTPFHFDRYSTLLLQFQGRKRVFVFEPWDERVISAQHTEGFMAHSGQRPPWNDELEALGTGFDFAPGEALHIPFIAGHYVKNGAEDVSVSLSIIFNTEQTQQQIRALHFNHYWRRAAGKLGWKPSAVGKRPGLDALKAASWQSASRLARLFRPGA